MRAFGMQQEEGPLAWLAKAKWLDFVFFLPFFLLWFGMAMPILNQMRPELAGIGQPEGSKRFASLRPRTESVRFPAIVRALPWLIGAGGLALGIYASLPAQGLNETQKVIVWLVVMLSWLQVGTLPMIRAGLLNEAEPLDPAGSPELLEGYARLRRMKAMGMFALGLILQCMMLAIAIPVTFQPEGMATLGAALGSGGAILGVLGGAFGTYAGLQRAKVHKLYLRLCAEQAAG
ncbi:MAG: hypothetical protein R3F17_02885 [Planctomycetota bacterium]